VRRIVGTPLPPDNPHSPDPSTQEQLCGAWAESA
jgi:hypothetical protein